ncbi:unnamed protein product, partial [Vitis vinifera]|uniref:Uncharacterized protein n=1 Tax=Vitis vinifera TaxID=29760 RepID=E0CVG6_VITVI
MESSLMPTIAIIVGFWSCEGLRRFKVRSSWFFQEICCRSFLDFFRF